MTILVLSLSSVTLVTFGNQSMVADSQTGNEGLGEAQEMLESAQAKARKDFNLVNPLATTTEVIGGKSYQRSLIVETLPDNMTKRVKSVIGWMGEHNRQQYVTLTALVTNFDRARGGGDTCSSVLMGNWATASVVNGTTDLGTIVGSGGSVFPITDIDAYKGKLYVTTNNSSANQNTFFVLDAATPSNPTLIGGVDNDIANNTGLNGVHVAGKYAYVASGSSAVRGQLQVIDVSVNPPVVVASTTIVNPSTGNSIFYKDGYVYLGLAMTPGGAEFNVIDVHDPLHPMLLGGYEVGAVVNSIVVKGNYAYLATANTSKELIILDVSNPISPMLVNSYDAPDAVGHGKALSVVGDMVYLGRTVTAANPELVVVDASSTSAVMATGTQETSSSINGLIVRDMTAFVLNKTGASAGQLQQWNIAHPGSITSLGGTLTLTAGGTTDFTLDCEGNVLYAGTNDGSNRGILSVITTP